MRGPLPSREEADAFGHRGLGKTGEAVYRAISGHPLTPAQVAAPADCHPRTAQRRLRQLRSVGLAASGPDGRWHAVQRDWADVAADLGVLGTAARRQERHARERVRYGQLLRAVNTVQKATHGSPRPRLKQREAEKDLVDMETRVAAVAAQMTRRGYLLDDHQMRRARSWCDHELTETRPLLRARGITDLGATGRGRDQARAALRADGVPLTKRTHSGALSLDGEVRRPRRRRLPARRLAAPSPARGPLPAGLPAQDGH